MSVKLVSTPRADTVYAHEMNDGELGQLVYTGGKGVASGHAGKIVMFLTKGFAVIRPCLFIVGETNGKCWTDPNKDWPRDMRVRLLKPGELIEVVEN